MYTKTLNPNVIEGARYCRKPTVVNRIRFTIGMQRPYARLVSEQRNIPLAEGPSVQVHKLDISAIRYGLGFMLGWQGIVALETQVIRSFDGGAGNIIYDGVRYEFEMGQTAWHVPSRATSSKACSSTSRV